MVLQRQGCSVLVTYHFVNTWRNFRLCLKSDDNFQEMQSHNIKPNLQIQGFPKRKKRLKKQTTICNSSRRGLDCSDILISGTEETHLIAWFATIQSEYKCYYGQDNGMKQKRLIFKRRLKLLQGSDGLLQSILDLKSYS